MSLTPFAPDTLLLVRFSTRANKRLGDPGSAYLSRQATSLAAGTILEVVEDEGYGYLLARRGTAVFQVHRSDVIERPSPEATASLSVRAQVYENALEDVKGGLLQAEAEIKDIKQALAEATEANRRLQAKLEEAGKWLASARGERDLAVTERDLARSQVTTLNTLIRKGIAQLQGLPE